MHNHDFGEFALMTCIEMKLILIFIFFIFYFFKIILCLI
jgi:hypothetical protein